MAVRSRAERLTALVGLLLLAAVVAGVWYLLNRPTWVEKPILAIAGATDNAVLDVTVAHPSCDNREPKVEVDESSETVSLLAEYDEHGSCDDVGLETIVTVKLDRHLGARSIHVDGPQGNSLACNIVGATSEACP